MNIEPKIPTYNITLRGDRETINQIINYIIINYQSKLEELNWRTNKHLKIRLTDITNHDKLTEKYKYNCYACFYPTKLAVKVPNTKGIFKCPRCEVWFRK